MFSLLLIVQIAFFFLQVIYYIPRINANEREFLRESYQKIGSLSHKLHVDENADPNMMHWLYPDLKTPVNKLILCIGDSITHGTRASNTSTSSYPAFLQNLLIENKIYAQVLKFGVPGSTVVQGMLNFINTDLYLRAIEYQPNIYLFAFGTNDAYHFAQWNDDAISAFKQGYLKLISSFLSKNSSVKNPIIYVCIPPPVILNEIQAMSNDFYMKKMEIVNNHLSRTIHEFAKENGFKVIEFLRNIPNSFDENKKLIDGSLSTYFSKDGVHPNDLGYESIANSAFNTIKDEILF